MATALVDVLEDGLEMGFPEDVLDDIVGEMMDDMAEEMMLEEHEGLFDAATLVGIAIALLVILVAAYLMNKLATPLYKARRDLHALCVGPPGAGKTTLLQQVTHICFDNGKQTRHFSHCPDGDDFERVRVWQTLTRLLNWLFVHLCVHCLAGNR